MSLKDKLYEMQFSIVINKNKEEEFGVELSIVINKNKEEEFGVELSRKGYSTKKGDTFTVDDVNNSELRKLLSNIDNKYFNYEE